MISDLQQQLGIDASFFPQFAIFIFLFLWMKFVFFGPFLGLIQKRENQSGGLSDESAKREEEAARLESEAAKASPAAGKKAMAEREAILAGARKEGSEMVASARLQAKQKIDQARASSAKSAEADLSALKAQVDSVSTLLVEKLTKAKVGL